MPALTLNNLHKNFGKARVIHGLNLTVEKGERHAIIGPNGAGKSTLFNLISGLYPVSTGDITMNGRTISNLDSHLIHRLGLSRSFQVTNIFMGMSVFENIRCALLWPAGLGYSFWHLCGRLKGVNAKAEAIIETINMMERRDVLADVLSYSEQRTLELGVTIASNPDIILLDEPTAGMSHSETEQAVALIRKVTEGKTLLIVEHDMSVVFDLADRISVLVYGNIIATDSPEKIRNNPAVQAAYLGSSIKTTTC
ncbi:MAG: ABC transporter ATP-binding protein [SAR324 cluster bacterium]|nr:ABC transporter ATP-binding protein [SAR324 cluster bacterium]